MEYHLPQRCQRLQRVGGEKVPSPGRKLVRVQTSSHRKPEVPLRRERCGLWPPARPHSRRPRLTRTFAEWMKTCRLPCWALGLVFSHASDTPEG